MINYTLLLLLLSTLWITNFYHIDTMVKHGEETLTNRLRKVKSIMHRSKDYPPLCRISALENLKKLLLENNGIYRHGMFTEAMKACDIIRDGKKSYLIIDWINGWTKNNIDSSFKIKNISVDIIDRILIDWLNLLDNDASRYRIVNHPYRRLHCTNEYIEPILHSYLAKMDEQGYSMTARAKYST